MRIGSFFRLWSLFLYIMPMILISAVAHAQTTQPAASESASSKTMTTTKRYDPWTSKQMTGNWGGLRDELADVGIKLELSYQQQFQQNFHGGLNTHNAHDFTGSYDLVLKLDFGKMKLIPNAGFYFKAKGTYGDGVNGDVGASGVARVNSDVGHDHPIYVKKWWYWHKFLDDKIELRLGLIETNKDLYDVSPYANHEDKDFLNRLSFRNATIPHRTGLGAHIKVEPVDWFYFQFGAFDAQSRERRTQFDTAFHDEAWFVGMGEFGFTPKWQSGKGPMPGRYRAGVWYDPRSREVYRNTFNGQRQPIFRGDHVGLYIGLDQMVWKENDAPKDTQGLGFFTRYGHAHNDANRVSDYWSAGLSYQGLIPTRDKDIFGFGVSQAIYSAAYRRYVREEADRETVYEWFYNFYLTPWCVITPDLQVVTNPGGDKDDRDAIVGGLRIRIIF